MALVSGPMMSVDASGKFAKSMVFSKWKGRNYVRQLVTPLNPRSAKQTGVRTMLGFLASMWKAKALPKWTGWTTAAEARSISEFDAYMSENLARWQMNDTPTEVYPATEAATPLEIQTQTLTGFAGYATVLIDPATGTSIWGLLIFRSTAEITVPSWANCVGVIEANGSSAVTFVDSPLDAGTYHYRTAAFCTDGTIGTIKADGSCVVT